MTNPTLSSLAPVSSARVLVTQRSEAGASAVLTAIGVATEVQLLHLHVPPPHHSYRAQDSGLTEIYLYGCAMPVRILMTRSRYKILERVGCPEVLVWTVLERVGCQMACCAVVTAHETLRARKLPLTTRAMLLPSFGPALPSGHHRRSSCRQPQPCETTRRRLLARLRGSNGCALPQCHMKSTPPGRSVPKLR
jgi:hypothetical protein